MKTFVATLTLAIGTTALVSRASNCCFGISIDGGPSGSIGELSDGQVRCGQGLPASTFCIDSNGGLTDQNGRGCLLTQPTTQFQCDAGANPTPDFGVGCDGTVSRNNNETFLACPTGDNGGYNIYTTPPADQQGCVNITLNASNCKPICTTPPSPPKATSSCPAELTGNWEYPHLIIPIDSTQPETALGSSYNGLINPTVSSIFNFDIPSIDARRRGTHTCSLIFMFPEQTQLVTSSFSLTGPGTVDFALLQDPASEETTWDSAPAVGTDYGSTTVQPGSSYTVATFPCPAGQRVGVEMNSGNGTVLEWFQDWNECPIGLYVTVT
ncbi:hypothetical protein K490DRAFT_72501 [Saccharata proteae CBS 121410]|uniref:Uncharacterized protein n=1 Tax=Saccharata proteae CBS 121410 TaxID=1314787 RepID=A0A6A5YD70_9PEZI|nr:hypothetical protein K490DRAFT_72501 [Saccharata proteae CBS 121410]